jgi:hypothetical protein
MRHLLPLALVVLALAGCNDDDPETTPTPTPTPQPGAGVVRLTLAPMWDGVPFDKNIIYTNISDERIQVQMLKFYLGDMGLVDGADTAKLFDVDLFTLTNGPLVRTYAVEPGSYSGVHVGLGVPAGLNGMNPNMWANSHPLSITNGMYWTWATMYRFVIFDGRFDTLATNTGTPPFQFSIHTGRNECFRTRDFALPLALAEGDTVDLRLELDVARLFYSANDTLYMATESQQHGSVQELPMSEKFSDMVSAAMSLTP